jgi:hypothetical protein
MEKISFPNRLTVKESSALIAACNQAEALAVDLELDLGGCTIVGPFGVTYVASCVALRRNQSLKTILIPPRSEKVRAFIAEVGLDRFIESGASAMHGMDGLRVGGLGLKTIRETVCGYDGRLTVISSSAKLTWRGQNELTIINPTVLLRRTAIEIDFMPHRPFHADTPGDLF